MYALGFFLCYEYMKRTRLLRVEDGDVLLFSVFLGVILGGRFGYVILYNLAYFLDHPIEILQVWK